VLLSLVLPVELPLEPEPMVELPELPVDPELLCPRAGTAATRSTAAPMPIAIPNPIRISSPPCCRSPQSPGTLPRLVWRF